MFEKFMNTLNANHDEFTDYKNMSNGFNNQLLVDGDCMKLLPLVPDNSVDHVDIDVPYKYDHAEIKTLKRDYKKARAEGKEYASMIKTQLKVIHMSNGFPYKKVLPQLMRIEKKLNMAIWCSHLQLYPLIKFFMDKHIKGFRYRIIYWVKPDAPAVNTGCFDHDCEYCLLVYTVGTHSIHGNSYTKHTVYTMPCNDEASKYNIPHPTVKPLSITRNIIYSMTRPNDTVLDCYMGSGTSGVASKLCYRNYIGFEISNDYYKIAINRIKQNNQTSRKLIDHELNRMSKNKYYYGQSIKATKLIDDSVKHDLLVEAEQKFNNAQSEDVNAKQEHHTEKSELQEAKTNSQQTTPQEKKPAQKSTNEHTVAPTHTKSHTSNKKNVPYSATKRYKYNYNHSKKAKFRRKMVYIKKHDKDKNSKYYQYASHHSRKQLYQMFLANLQSSDSNKATNNGTNSSNKSVSG